MSGRIVHAWACWALGLVLGCSPKAPPARSGNEAGASEAPGGLQEGQRLPRELEGMLTDGPCVPRMRAPLQAHLERGKNPDGTESTIFMIEPGEKLCFVGLDLTGLSPVETTVPTAEQAQRLVSVEVAIISIGTVMVMTNKFDRPFDYRAIIKRPGQPPRPTTVFTVGAGLGAVEHWPRAPGSRGFPAITPLEPGGGGGWR